MRPVYDWNQFIAQSFQEDLHEGDHTSLACIPAGAIGIAQLKVKEDGMLAGVELAEMIAHYFDSELQFDLLIADGSVIKKGDIAFILQGSARSILSTERLMLNVMQRMSGIATLTSKYVQALEGSKTKILDTRKTTPGMRVLDKLAVRIGGGMNHRMGLFDMIMLKDNHIDFAGGIENAIKKANEYLAKTGKNIGIEVETRNLNEVERVLATGGIQRIMLDNFNLDDTRKAVKFIGGRFEVESSGGINLDTVRGYAECGVDYISVGAITHQIQSIDMNLKKV